VSNPIQFFFKTFLGVLLVSSVGLAKAQTDTDYKEKYLQLLEKVSVLQDQLNDARSPKTTDKVLCLNGQRAQNK